MGWPSCRVSLHVPDASWGWHQLPLLLQVFGVSSSATRGTECGLKDCDVQVAGARLTIPVVMKNQIVMSTAKDSTMGEAFLILLGLVVLHDGTKGRLRAVKRTWASRESSYVINFFMPFKFMTSWHHIDPMPMPLNVAQLEAYQKAAAPSTPTWSFPGSCCDMIDVCHLTDLFRIHVDQILINCCCNIIIIAEVRQSLQFLFVEPKQTFWSLNLAQKNQSPRPVTTTSQPSPGKGNNQLQPGRKHSWCHKNIAANNPEPEMILSHKHFPMCSIWV